MPIKEISYYAGYRHAPSFVRAFRNQFGASPSEYRNAQPPG
jgi:AraC-like DNA-binding protein